MAHVFPCEFCKFPKTPFLQNTSQRLLPAKLKEFNSIDFIVDLEKLFKGNIHILTLVDTISKFIKVYALKGRIAITVRRFIFNYFYFMTF